MWGVFDPLSLTVLHTEKISLLQFLVAVGRGGGIKPRITPIIKRVGISNSKDILLVHSILHNVNISLLQFLVAKI